MERIFYSKQDTIFSLRIGTIQDTQMHSNSRDLVQVKSYFKRGKYGLVHWTSYEDDMVVIYDNATIELDLNDNLSYFVIVTDKKMTFISSGPDVVPRNVLSLKPKAGVTWLSLKAIRHETLNLPDRPCEPSQRYDFVECVERSITTKVGCLLPWWRFSVTGIPLCDNQLLLDRYDDVYMNFHRMDRNQVLEGTDCMMPCSFVQFKVSVICCI